MKREKAIEEILAWFQCIKRQLGCQVRQSGLTHAQWIALSVVREHEGVGIKKIAEVLGVSSSAATQLVDELENNDFIIRKTNPDDKRVLCVSLSHKAQKELKRMTQVKIAAFSDFFAVLSDEEFAQYVSLNKKIISRTQSI